MLDDQQQIKMISQQASGRCHSCLHSRRFDLPSGTRYWCRAFNEELDEQQHQAVRNCPRWSAFVPPRDKPSASRVSTNPLIKETIEQEDLLFWRLQRHLDNMGLDLKTLIVTTHPGTNVADLQWIDGLEQRFTLQQLWSLQEVISQLQKFGYHQLAESVERIYAAYITDRAN